MVRIQMAAFCINTAHNQSHSFTLLNDRPVAARIFDIPCYNEKSSNWIEEYVIVVVIRSKYWCWLELRKRLLRSDCLEAWLLSHQPKSIRFWSGLFRFTAISNQKMIECMWLAFHRLRSAPMKPSFVTTLDSRTTSMFVTFISSRKFNALGPAWILRSHPQRVRP